MQFVEQIKQELFFTNIIKKLKLFGNTVQKYMLQNKKSEDQLIILKNAPIIEEFSQNLLFWTLLFYNAILLPNFIHKTPTCNENYEVIMKINNANLVCVLQIQTLKKIMQSIDNNLKWQNIT